MICPNIRWLLYPIITLLKTIHYVADSNNHDEVMLEIEGELIKKERHKFSETEGSGPIG